MPRPCVRCGRRIRRGSYCRACAAGRFPASPGRLGGSQWQKVRKQVLDAFAQSKTTRDDPKVTASDVAKLLEAQSRTTPLGIALARLRDSLED